MRCAGMHTYRLKPVAFAFLRVCVTGRARLAGMERKSVLPAIADQKIEVQAAEVLARASYGLCTRVAHVHRGPVFALRNRV